MVILTEKRTDIRRTRSPPFDGATGGSLVRRCYVILSTSTSQLSSTLTATVARYRHSRGGIARPRFTATVRRPLVTSPVQPVASAAVVVSQPLCLPKRCVCTVVGEGFNSVRRTGVLECFDSEVPALWPACDHVSPSRIVSWLPPPVGSIRRVVRLLATETLDSRCWDGSVLRSVLGCELGIVDLCVGGDWEGIFCEGLAWLGSLCVECILRKR